MVQMVSASTAAVAAVLRSTVKSEADMTPLAPARGSTQLRQRDELGRVHHPLLNDGEGKVHVVIVK